MPQYSVRVDDDLDEEIAEYSANYDSRANALRSLLRRGVEYKRIQQENERLQRNMQQLIEQREEHQELVEYAEESRSVERERANREERIQSAPIWTRAKWWLTGTPVTK